MPRTILTPEQQIPQRSRQLEVSCAVRERHRGLRVLRDLAEDLLRVAQELRRGSQ